MVEWSIQHDSLPTSDQLQMCLECVACVLQDSTLWSMIAQDDHTTWVCSLVAGLHQLLASGTTVVSASTSWFLLCLSVLMCFIFSVPAVSVCVDVLHLLCSYCVCVDVLHLLCSYCVCVDVLHLLCSYCVCVDVLHLLCSYCVCVDVLHLLCSYCVCVDVLHLLCSYCVCVDVLHLLCSYCACVDALLLLLCSAVS